MNDVVNTNQKNIFHHRPYPKTAERHQIASTWKYEKRVQILLNSAYLRHRKCTGCQYRYWTLDECHDSVLNKLTPVEYMWDEIQRQPRPDNYSWTWCIILEGLARIPMAFINRFIQDFKVQEMCTFNCINDVLLYTWSCPISRDLLVDKTDNTVAKTKTQRQTTIYKT
jgi:hypothetical protein